MANDQEDPVKTIPTAKRNKLLLEASERLSGMNLNTTANVAGYEFYLTTLETDESVWADSHANMNSEVSFMSSQRVPRLAAAIKRINGTSVEELFEFPDEMSEEDQKYHSETPHRKRYWLMNQLLLWLGEQADPFIDDLWKEYAALAKERGVQWESIKKSCAGTPGGKSKATSSPEKESSQVTPT